MIYYIKDENSGKFAEAIFEIRKWNGSSYSQDMAQDLEENIPNGSVMSRDEYQEIIRWWEEDAASDGYDMTGLEVFSNIQEELVFDLELEDV